MNSKQAKRLRKQIRSTGVDPSQREYTVTEDSQLGLNPFALQITMSKDSGKLAYKHLKKLKKNASTS